MNVIEDELDQFIGPLFSTGTYKCSKIMPLFMQKLSDPPSDQRFYRIRI
jgi:hypothetical protein